MDTFAPKINHSKMKKSVVFYFIFKTSVSVSGLQRVMVVVHIKQHSIQTLQIQVQLRIMNLFIHVFHFNSFKFLFNCFKQCEFTLGLFNMFL